MLCLQLPPDRVTVGYSVHPNTYTGALYPGGCGVSNSKPLDLVCYNLLHVLVLPTPGGHLSSDHQDSVPVNKAVHNGTASQFGLVSVCVGRDFHSPGPQCGTQLSRKGPGGEGAPPFQALSL